MPDAPPDDDPSPDDPVERFRRLWAGDGRPDVVEFLAGEPGLQPDVVVDILRFDQQERWRRGEEVPAEWYLEQFPHVAADPDNGPLVLVYGEVLARTERGERPALTDFILRFPQFAEFLTLQWEVHAAIEGAATRHGTTMTFDEPEVGPRPAPAAVTVPGYEIEEEVGRGAVGVVYKAKQAAINRPCALKMVLEGQMGRTDKLTRFFEEGRAIARFKHPNIVGIYDLGTHETGPFMALEWVGGGTLADKIDGKPLRAAEAARLAATLARAAGYAHAVGVIHRDLKPANVLLTETGEPKIADFGLAKYLSEVNPDGSLPAGQPVGTPTYMAPEQTGAAKGGLTPAADVYGLGAVLYEMLTGRVPLAGATIQDTLRLVAEQEPVPPRQLNSSIPKDLETICLKCLEKDPKKRYPNGTALADDLTRYLANEPIAARPAQTAVRVARWLVRHPRAAAYATLALTSAVVGAATLTGWLVWLEEDRRRAELADQMATARQAVEVKASAEIRVREWRTLLTAARGIRRSGRAGQRTEALAKLREASSLIAEAAKDGKPAPDDLAAIRDEVVACLALPDAAITQPPSAASRDYPVAFVRPAAVLAPPSKPAAVSPDGRFGVTIDGPGLLRIWDLPAGRPLFVIPGSLGVGGSFRPDNKTLDYLANNQPARIEVTPSAVYRVERRGPGAPAGTQATSLNGKILAQGRGYGSIQIIDLAAGKPLAHLEAPELTRLAPLAFDPDGELTAHGIDSGAEHVWNLRAIRAELKAMGLDW